MNRALAPLLLAAMGLLLTMPADLPLHAARPGGCPAIADNLLWVPGGRTRIGSDSAYDEEGPSYETYVKGFWIDSHEVTNAQYAAFTRATGHVTQAEREGGSIVFVPPDPGQAPVAPNQWWRYVEGADWRHPEGPGSGLAGRESLPVVHVAFADALAYARWAGRSLPSEEQFEYAARAGAPETLDQPPPDRANTWQGRFPVSNDQTDGHSRLAPVGCFKSNSLGLKDMIGNAWEWTQSPYLPDHNPIPERGATPGNPSFDPARPDARVRVIKGGSFLCAPNYCARYRPTARHAQDELSGASHLGFRTVDTIRPSPEVRNK